MVHALKPDYTCEEGNGVQVSLHNAVSLTDRIIKYCSRQINKK